MNQENELSRDELLEELRRNLNVSSLSNTFENFKNQPGTAAALRAFKAIAEGTAPPLLLCHGVTGNGKTYLMEALVIELYKQRKFIRLLTGFDFLSVLKNCMEPGHIPPYEAQMRYIMQETRMLVDDLGAGTMDSKWAWSVWEEIISYRYAHRLLTVVTTNMDFSQLPERIQSRFSDKEFAVTVLNKGSDYRRRK